MGVTGLWRLIEPSGKPVPLETLENKVLAVDVSIWLHQAIKGFQDSQGGPLPNAHLLGIYHRVCKLLYFRVKPIFVFDGGVPHLKKETIAKRSQQRSKKLSEADRIQKQLLTTLLKHSAINKVLSEKAKAVLQAPNLSKLASKETTEDIYKLPPTDFDAALSSEDDTSESVDSSPTKHWDLHTIDEKSPHFKALPADVRHDILTDLKETRKQSSWGRLHELPKQSDDFSSFQMKRLLKRFSVQVSLEEAEKEMGGRSLSMAELETLLKDQGVVTSNDALGKRIASDENTKYLLIKDVKKAMDEASKRASPALESIQEEDGSRKPGDGEQKSQQESSTVTMVDSVVQTDEDLKVISNPDSEFQRDLEKAIQLSLQDVPSTSKENNGTSSKKHNFSFLENFDDADFNSSSGSEDDSHRRKNVSKILASAKSYMVEYSGLTPSEIAKIIGGNASSSSKSKINGVSKTRSPENSNSKSSGVGSSTSDRELEAVEECKTTLNDRVGLDGEDTTVSSSTTRTLQLQQVGTSIPTDTNEVTSSTNKEDSVPLEIINSEVLRRTDAEVDNDSELVEVMSNSSSDSGEDFLEVGGSSKIEKDLKPFEILIKPEETIEDDLFSDIFCDRNEENSISTSTKRNTNENKSVEELPKVCEEQVTTSNGNLESSNKPSVEPNNLPSTSGGDSRERPDITENSTQPKSVAAEFLRPHQMEQLKANPEFQEVGKQVLTTEQLREMEEHLIQEQAELIAERQSNERMAGSLTDQIYQEAQELLQLFGVPYIVAPMEAEAQCAFLDDISLTDGTITDDSDIWLFGGKTVYKNFFNQHKHVMEFRAENIQHHFKLSREQMILLALLVGSDYTVGVQGIGPVTALEVLAAFPPSKNLDQQLVSGLAEFRRWLVGERAVGPGRTTLRNKLKNVTISESFPSLQVVNAYLEPTVDSSRDPFSWAKPDMAGLIEFARKKFGWTRVKSEVILKPVFKRLNEDRIQRSIKDYFQTKHKIDGGEAESKMSKRVKKAVNRIDKGPNEDSDEDKAKAKPRKARKQKGKQGQDPDGNNDPAKSRKKRNPKDKQVTKSAPEAAPDDTNAPDANTAETAGFSSDEDIQILQRTRTESKQKLKQIRSEIKNEIEQAPKKPRSIASLHKKDVIPQKEQDKVDALRSKMKAIEVFRKSKKGLSYVAKRKVAVRQPKEDAELSESSSSD